MRTPSFGLAGAGLVAALLAPVAAHAECSLYATGNRQIVPDIGNLQNVEFTPDGHYAIGYNGNKVTIRDLRTGQNREIEYPDMNVVINRVTPDGAHLMTVATRGAGQGPAVRVHSISDPDRDEQTYNFHAPVSASSLTVSGNNLVGFAPAWDTHGCQADYYWNGYSCYPRSWGTSCSWNFTWNGHLCVPTPAAGASAAPAEEHVNKLVIKDTTTGEEREVRLPDDVADSPSSNTIRLSADGKTALVGSPSSPDVTVVDVEHGTTNRIFIPRGANRLEFSADGHSALVYDSNGSHVESINLSTGRGEYVHDRIPPNATDLRDNKEIYRDSSGAMHLRDLANGHDMPLGFSEPRFSSDGHSIYGRIGQGPGMVILPLDTACVNDNLHVDELTGMEAKCTRPDGGAIPISDANLFHSLEASAACQRPFDAAEWDRLTPMPRGGQLTRRAAEQFLLRFQKPGGFDVSRHLPILLAILRSDIPDKYPELTRGVLQNVLHVSSALYQRLIDDFHDKISTLALRSTSGLDEPGSLPRECRTDDEDQTLARDARSYLTDLVHLNPTKTTLREWDGLRPLSPLLARLSDQDKDYYIDLIAQTMADHAHDQSPFREAGVGTSTLYKFMYEATKPLFGEEPHLLTHLTFGQASRDGCGYDNNDNYVCGRRSEITPIQISTQAIDGNSGERDAHGLYVHRVPQIRLSAEQIQAAATGASAGSGASASFAIDQTYSWTTGGQTFHAHLTARPVASDSMLPTGDSPNYTELWAGERAGETNLSGLVIAGSNLGNSTAAEVIDEYLEYYQQQGFHFDTDRPVHTTGLHDKIGQWISSGETKYFVREAHMGGDDNNFMEITDTGMVWYGRKIRPDGKVETIRLVFPGPDDYNRAQISYADMRGWMQTRGDTGHGQMVFLNTGCWSAQQAPRQVQAVHNNRFVLVPTIAEGLTFGNDDEDAIRIMIDGIRNNKTYAQIRQGLDVNSDYHNRHNGAEHNWYIFPDEEDYRTHVTAQLDIPVEVNVDLTDQNGNNYMMGHSYPNAPATAAGASAAPATTAAAAGASGTPPATAAPAPGNRAGTRAGNRAGHRAGTRGTANAPANANNNDDDDGE